MSEPRSSQDQTALDLDDDAGQEALDGEAGPEEKEESQTGDPAGEEVPGVRGPIAAIEPPVLVEGEASTWGGEGGAGSYQGAPTISDAKVPPRPPRG